MQDSGNAPAYFYDVRPNCMSYQLFLAMLLLGWDLRCGDDRLDQAKGRAGQAIARKEEAGETWQGEEDDIQCSSGSDTPKNRH